MQVGARVMFGHEHNTPGIPVVPILSLEILVDSGYIRCLDLLPFFSSLWK